MLRLSQESEHPLFFNAVGKSVGRVSAPTGESVGSIFVNTLNRFTGWKETTVGVIIKMITFV
jgi:hypothetical protein